jgi:hypothetical protein
MDEQKQPERDPEIHVLTAGADKGLVVAAAAGAETRADPDSRLLGSHCYFCCLDTGMIIMR